MVAIPFTTFMKVWLQIPIEERLFTQALVEELDRAQVRFATDQRGLAAKFGVHESLLSLYRSGQRLPSITGFIELEKTIPGLMDRVVQGYYRRMRQADRSGPTGGIDEPDQAGIASAIHPLLAVAGRGSSL